MRHQSLTVAVAQTEILVSDVAGNVAGHAAVVRAAGARLVVFPELSLTGYDLDAPSLGLTDPALDALIRACREVGSVALVGAPITESGRDFIAITRRVAAPLSVEEAAPRVAAYVHGWEVVEVTGLIVLEAIRGVQHHSLSFWDAQIWATARLNQLPLLLSEDFNSGATVEGIRFVNPFAPTFSIAEWFEG